LISRVGGEHLHFLGSDGSVPLNPYNHDSIFNGLKTKGHEKQKVMHLLITFTTKNRSLNNNIISTSHIRANALAKLLPIEEVPQQQLHVGDSST
jgi:hypothetical protein